MNLPIKKDIRIAQGYTGPLDAFYIAGNYANYEITMQIKTTKTLTGDIVTSKANFAAGGNDNLLTTTYADGRTIIIPKMYYSDLQAITQEILYYEIVAKEGNKRVPLFKGTVIVEYGVVADDGSVDYFVSLAKRYIFKLTPPDTIEDILEPANFEGTLTISVADNVVTITSTAAEFTDGFDVGSKKGISVSRKVDANTYKIWLVPAWDTDYDYLIIDLYKLSGA